MQSMNFEIPSYIVLMDKVILIVDPDKLPED